MTKIIYKPTYESVNHIWVYLLGYTSDHDYSPTLEEIAWYLEEKNNYRVSKERVRQLCSILVQNGKITIARYKHRGITINSKSDET